MTPYPPGPGFPKHAPSVYIVTCLSFFIWVAYFVTLTLSEMLEGVIKQFQSVSFCLDLVGCRARIRTWAKGSKVLCATATQPGNLSYAGAEGRIRTDTGVAPQQFLRLSRLPFRHFGTTAPQLPSLTETYAVILTEASAASLLHAGARDLVPRGGIEPPTHGFSVRCSTD